MRRAEPSLWDLACNADRAGLFSWFTPEPNTGCYLWCGRINNRGYGMVSMCSRSLLAHRCAYRLTIEDVGADMDVHHVCGNPACINPRHLVSLTPEQHRLVHSGAARAFVHFVGGPEPKCGDPFDQGFIGLPFTPMVLGGGR
jgi:hypothetical protein